MILQPQFVMPGANSEPSVDGWWNLSGAINSNDVVLAYQPKGAASLAESYINLVRPGTLDAAVGVAPTLDALGWVSAGSARLMTGYVPTGTTSMIIDRKSVV